MSKLTERDLLGARLDIMGKNVCVKCVRYYDIANTCKLQSKPKVLLP